MSYYYDDYAWYKDGFIVSIIVLVVGMIVAIILSCMGADVDTWTDNGNGCFTRTYENNHINWTNNETTTTVYCEENR